MNTFAMISMSVSLRGFASGYHVAKVTIARINRCPALVIVKGLTRSITTLAKGWSMKGKEFNGAWCFLYHAILWYSRHDLHSSATSEYNPAQK